MEIEGTPADILAQRLEKLYNKKEVVSTSTNFKYIPSMIIQTLEKSETHLLYIEVPNEIMLERVEKGLLDVYLQKKSLIVGIDKCDKKTCTETTKFIHFNLSEVCDNSSKSQKIASKYFKDNFSNIKVNDR